VLEFWTEIAMLDKYCSTLWQNAAAAAATAANDDDDVQVQAGHGRPADESISDTRHRRSRFSYAGAAQQAHDGRRFAYYTVVI